MSIGFLRQKIASVKVYLQRLSPFISSRYMYLYEEGKFWDWKERTKVKLSPNLVIIGAQKSGTTSLHHYLELHPEIFMSSPIKEPGYYCDFEFISNYFKNIAQPVYYKSRADILKNYMLQGYKGLSLIHI